MTSPLVADLQTQLEHSLWLASTSPSALIRKGNLAYSEELAQQLTADQVSECVVEALIMCAQLSHPKHPGLPND